MEWLRMRGRFTSGKSQYFILLLAGLLVGLFAGILLNTHSVYAADATWSSNGEMLRDGDTYSSLTDTVTIEAMGIDKDSLVFSTKIDTSSSARVQTVKTISLPAGTDPSSANAATAIEFSFTPPSDWNKASESQIAIDSSTFSQISSVSSCNIDQIGWMVCGPSTWIAGGVDTIYGWIEDFLTVQELEINNQNSTLYQAWNIMRGIANVAFIIAFLIIIYSYVTSYGVSNYGLKKLAPRLIIAALLVNLSFYICALAIDLSNILGHSLKQLFDDLYNSLIMTGGADNRGITDTSSIIQAVLSGGILAVGGGIAVGGSLTAAAPLVLPILLTVFVGLLVALVVFAARQALVVILTIIAPLAFVCYLLPGTEKWFEKWRSTFFTMLLFFPAFAVVFGGAKLSGMIIISNASTIVMAVIGWAVQLAPLALAPLVMKFGGGVLNRVAGIVNDPSKGVIDKSKQWAQRASKLRSIDSYDKMQARRQRWKKDGNALQKAYYGVHGGARRLARGIQNQDKLLNDKVANAEKSAENQYHTTAKYKKQDLLSKNTAREAEYLSNQSEADFGIARAGQLTPSMVSMQKKWHGGEDKYIKGIFDNMRNLEDEVAVESLRKSSAQRVLEKQLADSLNSNTHLQNRAGRPEDILFGGERGSQRVNAQSLKTVSSANEDAIKNAETIINHSNLSDLELVEMAKGNSQRGITVTDDIRTASIRQIAGGKNAFALNKFLNEVNFDTLPGDFQQEMGIALLSNSAKPPWIGGVVSAQIKDAHMTGAGSDLVRSSMTAAINNGKLSAEVLVTTDAAYLNDLSSALNDPGFKNSLNAASIAALRREINEAQSQPLYSGRIGERSKPIQEILSRLP